jgi:hypothetical protein
MKNQKIVPEKIKATTQKLKNHDYRGTKNLSTEEVKTICGTIK